MLGWSTTGVAVLLLLVDAIPGFVIGPRTGAAHSGKAAAARSRHLTRAPAAGPRARAGAQPANNSRQG